MFGVKNHIHFDCIRFVIEQAISEKAKQHIPRFNCTIKVRPIKPFSKAVPQPHTTTATSFCVPEIALLTALRTVITPFHLGKQFLLQKSVRTLIQTVLMWFFFRGDSATFLFRRYI